MGSGSPRQNDLAIEQDTRWERGEAFAHRVGVVVLTLIVISGLAGAFGRGALSTSTVDRDGVVMTYERIVRQGAETVIEIESRGPTSSAALAEVLIGRSSSVVFSPQPSSMSSDPERLEVILDPPTRTLRIAYLPSGPGVRHGWVRVGTTTISFQQIVLP